MSEQPNIPFMPAKGVPPLHLRDWTPAEMDQFRRMIREAEERKRVAEQARSK